MSAGRSAGRGDHTLARRELDRRQFLHRAALSTAGLGALLYTGCGSSQGGGGPQGSPASGRVVRGGTLVFGNELAEIPSLNQNEANAAGYSGVRTVQHMFEGLLGWDFYSDPTQEPPPAPALATAWESSPDRLKWTFRLREGVTFHDGTPFDADAVMFNFERIWNDEFKYYDQLVSTFVQIWTQQVKDFRKLGPSEIEVTLAAPRPLDKQIQYALIGSPTAIKKYGKEFGQHPTGTGPFRFDKIVPGQSIEYLPFEKHWNRPYPSLDRLVYRPIADASARTASLISGETNFIAPVQPDDIARLESAGMQISQEAYAHYWTWWFNHKEGPFSDKRVRQAANYATDKESLVKNLLKGTGVAEYQPVPPYSKYYSESLGEVYRYDPRKAKELLAAAGYEDGVDVTVHVPTSGSGMMYPVPMSQFIQSNLREVGIRVNLRTWEWSSFVQNVLVAREKPPWDAFVLGHAHMDESFYWTNYNTEAWAPTSWNTNLYSHPEVDKLSNEILRVTDEQEIVSLAHRLNEILVEDASNLWVCHDTNPKAYAPNVTGFVDSHSWAFAIPFERVGVAT